MPINAPRTKRSTPAQVAIAPIRPAAAAWEPLSLFQAMPAHEEVVAQGAVASSSEPGEQALESPWVRSPYVAFESWVQLASNNNGRGYSEETQKVYRSMWGKFVRYCQLEDLQPALVAERQILGFLQALASEYEHKTRQNRGKQAAFGRDDAGPARQARRYLYLLAATHGHIMRLGVRIDNPAQAILDRGAAEPVRPDPSALQPVSQVALRTGLSKARTRGINDWRELRDSTIVLVIIGSGLTSRQLRHLEVDDRQLNLHSSPPWVAPVAAKTGLPTPGRIPLSKEAATALQEWIPIRQAVIRDNAGGEQPSKVLFPATRNGDVMSASGLYRVVAAAVDQARESAERPPADHLGPRTLRHTFAMRQLQAGRPLEVLQKWLGHRKLSSTAVYQRLIPDPLGFQPV